MAFQWWVIHVQHFVIDLFIVNLKGKYMNKTGILMRRVLNLEISALSQLILGMKSIVYY